MGLWCLYCGVATRVKESYYDSREEGRSRTDEEHYAELVKLAGDHYIEDIIVDPSAASFREVILRHGKYTVLKGINDVINGIRVTDGMLAAGIIRIGAQCHSSIKEFGMYRWNEKATEDEVIKENDHAMDDIRYFAYTVLRIELDYMM